MDGLDIKYVVSLTLWNQMTDKSIQWIFAFNKNSLENSRSFCKCLQTYQLVKLEGMIWGSWFTWANINSVYLLKPLPDPDVVWIYPHCMLFLFLPAWNHCLETYQTRKRDELHQQTIHTSLCFHYRCHLSLPLLLLQAWLRVLVNAGPAGPGRDDNIVCALYTGLYRSVHCWEPSQFWDNLLQIHLCSLRSWISCW